jgi:uncharacterized protein (TIGR02266 family)
MRNPATRTILVAHESAVVTDRFVAALEGAGHRAIAVGSGTELLRRLQTGVRDIDLIIMDLRLPDAGGVGIVRTLRDSRDSPGSPSVPVLVFSGTVSGAKEVRDLAELGVAGYLSEHSAVQHILPSIAPHLFPDSFNRRSGPRVVLGVPVQYRFGSTIAAAVTLNIGSGGIAIRTASPLDSGSKVGVRFRIPGSRRDVDAEGRVVWSDRRVGMGVQFEHVDPAGQAVIDSFAETHGQSRRGA